MHELSIALGIIDVAAEEAERLQAKTIRAVHLRLGALSGVVKEALQSAFDLAREGTCLEESLLIIEDVPILVFCATCQAEREIPSIQEFVCSQCGTPCGDVRSGTELEVIAMEIDA